MWNVSAFVTEGIDHCRDTDTYRAVVVNSNPSDDLYRFPWDGRLQDLGISAYAQAPEDIMAGNPDDPTFCNSSFPI